ncbi:uncharacterized protein LOC144354694 [Saccoglossus kowalevskii]
MIDTFFDCLNVSKLGQKKPALAPYRSIDDWRSFVAVAKELLCAGVEFVLSEKFTQDPLEEYFSRQRACIGHNDNPTVEEFSRNTLSFKLLDAAITGNN